MKCVGQSTFYAQPYSGNNWTKQQYTVLTAGGDVQACPATSSILLSQTEYTNLTANLALGSYDYATGAAFFAFAFSGVMVSYFSSHVIGLVLNFIRRQ